MFIFFSTAGQISLSAPFSSNMQRAGVPVGAEAGAGAGAPRPAPAAAAGGAAGTGAAGGSRPSSAGASSSSAAAAGASSGSPRGPTASTTSPPLPLPASIEREQLKQTAAACLARPSFLAASALLQAQSPARARLNSLKTLCDLPVL
jgi:hypothetical protein